MYAVKSEGEKITLISQSISSAKVDLWQERRLELKLTFEPSNLEPLFSGACWAGTVVWPAALLLAEELRKRRAELVVGKTVVELGAGVGVPGMAARHLGARSVLLTEQPPLPDLLKSNSEVNFPAPEAVLKVESLDWADESLEKGRTKFDLILVSDCVYKELYGDSWNLLAKVIKKLSHASTITLNSMERRKDDGIPEFLEFCKEIGIKWRKLYEMKGPEDEDLELYEMRTNFI